jgi:hypothetical protein
MRSIANGAGDFSNGHLSGGGAESRDVALILSEPIGNLEAEGDGLGMNAMSASDLRCLAKLVSAKIENLSKHHQAALN